jgi:hypothetical protein
VANISAHDGAVLADNQAFCETVPFPKSDTIVMLGSGAFKSGSGIPKSARNMMDSDELLEYSFLFDRIYCSPKFNLACVSSVFDRFIFWVEYFQWVKEIKVL